MRRRRPAGLRARRAARAALVILVAAMLAGAATPGDPGCAVVPRPGAEIDAVERDRLRTACAVARARFRELFGGRVPDVRVEVWTRGGYRTGVDGRTAVVFWPEAARGGAAAEDPAMLPHEIAHVLLAARFYHDHDDVAGAYGTPLPDWLEEAVAIWAEPPATRDARLARARDLGSDRLDLRRILGTDHPAATRSEILTVRDGAAPPPDDALWDFYPQAIAVLSFVLETGGPRAVEALTRAAIDSGARGPGPGQRSLSELTGLPGDDAAILRAWRDWLHPAPPAG